MLAYLMEFPDEAAAKSALAEFMSDGEWGPNVISGQRVVLARAKWDQTDPDTPVMTAAERIEDGYFVTVVAAAAPAAHGAHGYSKPAGAVVEPWPAGIGLAP